MTSTVGLSFFGGMMDFYELGVWPGWEHGEYPPYWEELRRFVFRLDGYRCQRCGKHLPGAKLNCHHVIPKEKGGSDNPSNLVTLCFSCHDRVHDALIFFEETQGGMVTSETVSPEPEREEMNLVCVGQIAPGVLLHVPADRLPKRFDPVDPEAALSEQIEAEWIPDALKAKWMPNRERRQSWRHCKYFEWVTGKSDRAACRRIGKTVRGESYKPYFDYRYWHYVWRKDKRRYDWRYEKFGGKVIWASEVCPKCKLFRRV